VATGRNGAQRLWYDLRNPPSGVLMADIQFQVYGVGQPVTS